MVSLLLASPQGTYEPGKRHWLKVKKDYLNEGAMADTADLVVLGAFYGQGSKGQGGLWPLGWCFFERHHSRHRPVFFLAGRASTASCDVWSSGLGALTLPMLPQAGTGSAADPGRERSGESALSSPAQKDTSHCFSKAWWLSPQGKSPFPNEGKLGSEELEVVASFPGCQTPFSSF